MSSIESSIIFPSISPIAGNEISFLSTLLLNYSINNIIEFDNSVFVVKAA